MRTRRARGLLDRSDRDPFGWHNYPNKRGLILSAIEYFSHFSVSWLIQLWGAGLLNLQRGRRER